MWSNAAAIAVYEAVAAQFSPSQSVITTASFKFEMAQSLRRGSGLPFEGEAAQTSTSTLGFESLLTLSRLDRSISEVLAAPGNVAYVPSEASATSGLASHLAEEGLSGSGSYNPALIEIIGGISVAVDGLIAIENLASLAPGTTAPVEQESGVESAIGASNEWLLGLLQRAELPIERGASGGGALISIAEGLIIEIPGSPPPAVMLALKSLRSPGRIRLLTSPGRTRFSRQRLR